MLTIGFGIFIIVLCLYGLMTSRGAFDGVIVGPGFILGCAILIVGLVDKYLL